MAAGPGPQFSCEIAELGDRLVVTVRGELDLATAPEVEALLLPPAREGRRVGLDLRALEFMDSSGVRVLITAHQAAEAAGGRVTVAVGGEEAEVARILEISGLRGLLDLVDEL